MYVPISTSYAKLSLDEGKLQKMGKFRLFFNFYTLSAASTEGYCFFLGFVIFYLISFTEFYLWH